MIEFVLCFLILSSLLNTADASENNHPQYDPTKEFCRRFGHSAVQMGSRLYIDGGYVDWESMTQHPQNSSNRNLLFNDLTNVNQGAPQLRANLTKHNGSSYAGNALWADSVNQYVFQFGGESILNQNWNGKGESYQPQANGLSVYDAFLDKWNSSSIMRRTRPTAWGSSVSIDERGEGYVFGGWINNLTDPKVTGQSATTNLIQFNMSEHRFKNFTGPDSIGRAEGVLVFLPASDAGVLIHFGGIQDPTNNGIGIGSSMDMIDIYDIQSGKWYNQTASGDIPDMRRRFCAGATWSDDYSSYNIYIYGGMSAMPQLLTEAHDDIYILSLPSFVWLKWWPGSSTTLRPRHSMTCSVISRSQMILVGGTFPYDQDCDSSQIWGTHTINLSSTSPNASAFTSFDPSNSNYSVPPELISIIGGGPQGGATLRSPKTWSSSTLSTMFSKVAKFPKRTPTRSFDYPKRKPTLSSAQKDGIIAGSTTVGSLLICLVIISIICYKQRRNTIPERPETRIELPTSRTPDASSVPLGHGSSSDMEQKSTHSFTQDMHPAEISMPATPQITYAPLLNRPSTIPISYSSEEYMFSNPNPGRRLSTRNYIAYLYRSGYSTDQVRHILTQNYQQAQAGSSPTSPMISSVSKDAHGIRGKHENNKVN